MVKSASPIRLQEELVQSATTAAALHHRSIAEQIEYWASLGRQVARFVDPDTLLEVASGLAALHVEPVASKPIPPEAAFAALVSQAPIRYQASLEHPGALEQITADGQRTIGTFHKLFLEPLGVPFINADNIARLVYPEASEAHSYLVAKALGYTIILVLIHLDDPMLNQARIAQRIAEGGHHVPPEKVISRIPRMLSHVKASLPLCDEVRLIDNSSSDQPFLPVLTIRQGVIELHQHPLTPWADALIGA
ncbi:MAG: hypothetical protein WD136_02570 [Cyanobium sp.]